MPYGTGYLFPKIANHELMILDSLPLAIHATYSTTFWTCIPAPSAFLDGRLHWRRERPGRLLGGWLLELVDLLADLLEVLLANVPVLAKYIQRGRLRHVM